MVALYLFAVILICCSGLPALIRGRFAGWGEGISVVQLLTGSILALVAALTGAWQDPAPMLAAAWSVPGGNFLVELDGLAAVFLLPALIILALGGIYGIGYLSRAEHGAAAGRLRLFYGVLGASIALIPVCRNSLLFLMAWEMMAIASFLLILTDQEKEEARRAAYLYLILTHAGTLALFAMFILLAQGHGSFDFPGSGSLDGAAFPASAIFLLGLFGFGLKAGLMPLHIWLPGAHAAAPSHVSALMSGVVIKMGIYGLIRLTGFYSGQPVWWGGLILALGVLSAIMGVVFALAQHDIKRLLAYHSVENIGIILIGLGCALLGRSAGQPLLVSLGLAGALLHVINHGLFKSLLFLGAGSVIKATGTREIDHYGGLLRTMPRTALFFLGGSVAISGLPPGNGFVSEWLIYLGLLHGQTEPIAFPFSMAILAVPALAMTGALALACFVKVFGLSFLGLPRKHFPVESVESPKSMLIPMAGLFGCCLLIGLIPGAIIPLLERGLAAWHGGDQPVANLLVAQLAPTGRLSLAAFLLLLCCAVLYLWQRTFPASGRQVATWGCGSGQTSPRIQYTASSFAEMLTRLFRWSLWSDSTGGRAIGFFPAPTRFAIHTPDLVLERVLEPISRMLARSASMIRAFVHQGNIGIYLLYSAITLCLLLFWL